VTFKVRSAAADASPKEMSLFRRGLRARLRARLHTDERGFTILEVMVAIGIIATAMTALAYTVTLGLTYGSLARQKQTATGIADQMMEQVRGLAWDKITAGHVSTDLSVSDPNLATGCAGDAAGVYRFISCTANGTPGSGEKVVAAASACPVDNADCVYPLIRHTGTITQNNIAFTWRVYDTNSCPTSTTTGCTAATPYRLTVVVTWTGGRSAPNKIVRVQSLFWSPGGCRSTATHPFAAPCQPFFYGVSKVPQVNVHIEGAIDGIDEQFTEGDLFGSGVESTVQQEQLSQVQGSFSQSGVRVVKDGVPETAGGDTASTSAADTDPGTTATTYSKVTCGSPAACAGGTVSANGGGSTITFTAPAGETAESDSTTQAWSTNVCPPPSDTAQVDQKACGGSRIQQGGVVSAITDLNPSVSLGTTTIARIANAAGSPNKTFVDRVQYATSGVGFPTTGCAPVNNADGCVESRTSRAVGTVNVGGLPTGLTAPGGWAGANAWNGFYFSIVGYQDSATTAVGTNLTSGTCSGTSCIPAPTASVTAGNLYCWNGVNGYNTVAASSASAVTCAPLIFTQLVSGHVVSVTVQALNTAAATITKTPTTSATTQTDANAQVLPPSATIQYSIAVDGINKVVLTITVNLNTLEARGVYSTAPTTGS
jgi:prepilin-type N-terminal cleavage/methylation domain-containing protein